MVTDVASYHPVTCGYYVQGTKGCFDFERAAVLQEGTLTDWRNLEQIENEHAFSRLVSDHTGHGSAFEEIVKRFIDAIDHDTDPTEDLSLALHITAIGWAVDESLASGKKVAVAM